MYGEPWTEFLGDPLWEPWGEVRGDMYGEVLAEPWWLAREEDRRGREEGEGVAHRCERRPCKLEDEALRWGAA